MLEAKLVMKDIDELCGQPYLQVLENLSPIVDRVKRMPELAAEISLHHMENKLGLSGKIMSAIRRHVEKTRRRNQKNQGSRPCARHPGLVELVSYKGKVHYLITTPEGIKIHGELQSEDGSTLLPPDQEDIPYDLIDGELVTSLSDHNDRDLYYAVVERLKRVAVLPSEAHYHLCAVYVFFTYLTEQVEYYPYLWFYGPPERGKSRLIEALINLSWRGYWTETMNEAFIFRFADIYGGTIGIDVVDVIGKAKERRSQDLLLGRFKRGIKTPRVIDYRKGPFKDTIHFKAWGPTIIGTNRDIPAEHPLRTRCIQIIMPEASGKYENICSAAHLQDLRTLLVIFRARYILEVLPSVEKPVSGRLGDLMQPLLQVARILPFEATENLELLIKELVDEKKDTERETLAGRIVESLYILRSDGRAGKLSAVRIAQEVNSLPNQNTTITSQKIGFEIKKLGIKTKKSSRKIILWDETYMSMLFKRYGHDEHSQLSQLSQTPMVGSQIERETEKQLSLFPNLDLKDEKQEANDIHDDTAGDQEWESGTVDKKFPTLRPAPAKGMGDLGQLGKYTQKAIKGLSSVELIKAIERALTTKSVKETK
jgi:hypothetical protein